MRRAIRLHPAAVDLHSRDPGVPVDLEAAALRRDQAAAERDARALQRDLTLRLELADLVGDDVRMLVDQALHASARDREAAGYDREAARSDREAAALDRSRATRDELTGAWRRGAGLSMLDAEINRAERFATGLVIAYVDIAGLKAINDAFGHPAGDRTLVAVVQTLHQQLRSYDSVIRMGGDEFVCILPKAAMAVAARRMDQIRQVLRGMHPPVTLRVGLARLEPDDITETLIERADVALIASRGLSAVVRPLERNRQ